MPGDGRFWQDNLCAGEMFSSAHLHLEMDLWFFCLFFVENQCTFACKENTPLCGEPWPCSVWGPLSSKYWWVYRMCPLRIVFNTHPPPSPPLTHPPPTHPPHPTPLTQTYETQSTIRKSWNNTTLAQTVVLSLLSTSSQQDSTRWWIIWRKERLTTSKR